MTTLNGFLSQSIGEPLRMTEGQKIIVLRGMHAALESSPLPSPLTEALADAFDFFMISIPNSTACACCDFYREGDCAKWESEIPAEWLPKGCEAWQDSGAPF